jgi:hypothetical protein
MIATFFRIWFSRESCPQKRSSSAILSLEGFVGGGLLFGEGCLAASLVLLAPLE